MLHLCDRLNTLYRGVYKFNLFRSKKSLENDDDGFQLKNELISTRLFIFLLLISLLILLIYTSQVQVTHTVTVSAPSVDAYSSLYTKYAETLVCPCENVAIAQGEFISLIPVFHQVCNSDFVKVEWMAYLNSASRFFLSNDFRDTGGLFFQILTSFCQLAQDAINISLPKFYATDFVSNDVLNAELLYKQSQLLIELYLFATANEFAYAFDYVRDATFVNGLLSGLLTSFDFQLMEYNAFASGYRVTENSKSYDEPYKCDCSITPLCVSPASIYDNITHNKIFVVPGFFTGCQLVEAMRQSNLQCLYNQTCLDQIKKYVTSSVSFNATPLSTLTSSRYNVSTNVSQLLSNLMIETWFQNISYTNYYRQCQPVQCIYTRVGKNSALYIPTTLLGLFGGLYKAFYFLVPIVVKMIRRRSGKTCFATAIEIQKEV